MLSAGALCCLAVGGSAAASRADKAVLKGPLERGGRAAITVSSGHTEGTAVNRYRWELRRISVRCSGHRRSSRLPVTGGFVINAHYDHLGKPWGISATAEGGIRHPDYATKVSGRLVSEEKAQGWVRVYGAHVPLRSGRSAACDSGRLRWVARR